MKTSNTSERLKWLMDEKGLRQRDIIEMCKPFCDRYGVKMSRADLSQWISGKVKPRQDKLSVLAMGLGVNEIWLMGYDVPEKGKGKFSNEEVFEMTKIQRVEKLIMSIINELGYFCDESYGVENIPIDDVLPSVPSEIAERLKSQNAQIQVETRFLEVWNDKIKKRIDHEEFLDFVQEITDRIESYIDSM